ncbi:enkurin [Brachionichthys hirsutus]|uniref:enkurin n=1 Tax=Brachionichthys hirsutus TaxID=412623 RepID=UPI0036050CF2
MSEVVYPPESVYNVLPRDEVHSQKPPRYVSKFRPAVLLEEKSVKDVMKTMGPAEVQMPSPDTFLKKHSKEAKSADSEFPLSSRIDERPPVPTRADVPPMGVHTERNFIKTATAVPVKPKPISVDSRKGDKQLLENSGLVPKYIKKKHYGEVPEYLQQRNHEEQSAQEEYNSFVREQREQGAVKHLSDEERRAVLEGLKKNWDQLHREYQGLSFVMDTVSKRSRKHRLEAAMRQLEDDIQIFEKFKTIFIPNER